MTTEQHQHLERLLRALEPLCVRRLPDGTLTVNGLTTADWRVAALTLGLLTHAQHLLDCHKHLYPQPAPYETL